MKKPLVVVGGVVGLLALAVVAVIVIQLLRSDDPDLATEAPLIGSQTAEGETSTGASNPGPTSTSGNNDGPAAPSPDGLRHFAIVPEESEAKYVVRESLRGIKTNAVGTTNAIEGDIYLTEDGLATSETSSFRVDLSTLTSDEGRRDSFIKSNTLQTDQFPYAEFMLEEVSGFPPNYAPDTETELTISGTLTIRDVSNPVTWTVKARQLDDTLTAVADLTITFQDYGMNPPSVPIATAEDEIQLQVVLVAREP